MWYMCHSLYQRHAPKHCSINTLYAWSLAKCSLLTKIQEIYFVCYNFCIIHKLPTFMKILSFLFKPLGIVYIPVYELTKLPFTFYETILIQLGTVKLSRWRQWLNFIKTNGAVPRAAKSALQRSRLAMTGNFTNFEKVLSCTSVRS